MRTIGCALASRSGSRLHVGGFNAGADGSGEGLQDDAPYRSLVSRHGNLFVYRGCGACRHQQPFSWPNNWGGALQLRHDPTSAMATWRSVSDGLRRRPASALLRNPARRGSPHPMSFVPPRPVVTGMCIPASRSTTCSGYSLTFLSKSAKHRPAT